MQKLFYILLCFVLFAGCGQDVAVRQRTEELCRILFDKNISERQCDSVVALARDLPAGARMEVLLEAVQASGRSEFLEKKEQWLEEARRIAPKERQVEVVIAAICLEFEQNMTITGASRRKELIGKLKKMESTFRFTPLQEAYYLYTKVKMNDEMNLFDSWRWMKEALSLAREQHAPRLEIRMLELFATTVNWGGDGEQSLSYSQEAYRLREAEHLPVNELEKAAVLAEKYLNLRQYPEAIRWNRKALALLPGRSIKRLAFLLEIADIYVRTDSLAQAVMILKEAETLPFSVYTRGTLYTRMADVFSALNRSDSTRNYLKKAVEVYENRVSLSGTSGLVPFGAIPAYAGYAGVLWQDDRREEALRLLEKVIPVIPCFGDSANDIHLESYLDALLQLSGYYRECGRDRQAMELLFRRDSLRTRFNRADMWQQKKKISEQYQNQELRATVQWQEEQLATRRHTLLLISCLCVLLALLASMFGVLYRQKLRRLDALFLRQKEVERLTRHREVSPEPESSDKILFLRLEKIVLSGRLFRNPNLTLDELCPLVGSNRSYVSACVNKSTDMNFSNWLNRLRVDYIIAAINDGRNDLNELSTEAGFASVTSFFRHFKLVTQMSPKQYLERQRKTPGRTS